MMKNPLKQLKFIRCPFVISRNYIYDVSVYYKKYYESNTYQTGQDNRRAKWAHTAKRPIVAILSAQKEIVPPENLVPKCTAKTGQ